MAIQMLDAAMSGLEGLLPEGVIQRLAHGHVAMSREEAESEDMALWWTAYEMDFPTCWVN